MSITYRNGEHHRNPSGCHNKVKWLLSQSKWDISTFTSFTDKLIKELLEKDMRITKSIFSWLDAISIARWILDGNVINLPYNTFEKYPWALKYCEIVDDKKER